ncbi:ribonuclease D [Larsenimonas suaedae]|uniref:Ribonuclease D n=1 Tax=Larsenimonas suaedae TaxID=1851019 RepID=A0ABU1GY00_9GAMM|nr:ribonuclease D [Larsenimonas suaedae]MCM2972775.1 ribonuclease D [Larsenimonas suaedae]MDR5896874.1 ribonuclease D [Larsenimonas suaedae]
MSNNLPAVPNGIWIDAPEALDEACRVLSDLDVLALDTEFLRETTFHPKPALLQLGNASQVYLIDMIALDTPTEALKELLGPTGPLKLLHACAEDLEVLRNWLGSVPQPIADTQLAEAFVAGEPALSYQRLVERYLDIHVPKEATRSDWTLRPLSEVQCAYASADVAYLSPIWMVQRKALDDRGLLEWFEQECQRQIDKATREEGDEDRHLRHRQIWRLNPRQFEAYRLLCQWREAEVRARDVPRKRLATDALLFELATHLPKNRFELAAIEGMHPPVVKKEGDALLATLKDVAALSESELPTPPPSPLGAEFKQVFKSLKQLVNQKAEAHGLPSELVANRRDLETWTAAVMSGAPIMFATEWRRALLATSILDIAAAFERSTS